MALLRRKVIQWVAIGILVILFLLILNGPQKRGGPEEEEYRRTVSPKGSSVVIAGTKEEPVTTVNPELNGDTTLGSSTLIPPALLPLGEEETAVTSKVGRKKRRRGPIGRWDALEESPNTRGFVYDTTAVNALIRQASVGGAKAVKDSVLTYSAKKKNIGAKFAAACPKNCVQGPNDHQPSFMKPDFCDPGTQFKATAWDLWSPAFGKQMQEQRKNELAHLGEAPLPAVFVALGTRFYGPGGQSYVVESIRQWRKFHHVDESRIYLIVDKTLLGDERLIHSSVELSFNLISYQDIYTQHSKRYEEVFYIQGFMHPGGDRSKGNQHFNRLVSQRFHAIHGLMEKLNLRHVVHMEGDNMVYGDMREIAKAAASCGHEIATVSATAGGMIPGVVYIKDSQSLEKLVIYLNDFLSCSKKFGTVIKPGYANDMTYLMNYYEYYGSQAMGQLPSWEHAQGESCMADVMGRAFLFDSASFGQWYSFAKKRNQTQPPLHIRNAMKGRFIDATPKAGSAPKGGVNVDYSDDTRLRWVVDAFGRRLPMWKNYFLLSLHIHAKNLEEFAS